MHISWSVKDMPELAGLSENDKAKAMYDAALKAYNHWQAWAGIALIFICASIGGYVADVAGAAIGGAVGGGVCAPVILRMQAREIRWAFANRKETSAVQ